MGTSGRSVDPATIAALLSKPDTAEARVYPVQEQHGPLRRFEKEMRCASRRCGSSTFLKVRGVQYCTAHALIKLNEMLVEMGVEE